MRNFYLLVLLLQQGAQHLHGGLAAGDILQILGILVLQILDPCGAAAGEHGERTALLQALPVKIVVPDAGEGFLQPLQLDFRVFVPRKGFRRSVPHAHGEYYTTPLPHSSS